MPVRPAIRQSMLRMTWTPTGRLGVLTIRSLSRDGNAVNRRGISTYLAISAAILGSVPRLPPAGPSKSPRGDHAPTFSSAGHTESLAILPSKPTSVSDARDRQDTSPATPATIPTGAPSAIHGGWIRGKAPSYQSTDRSQRVYLCRWLI